MLKLTIFCQLQEICVHLAHVSMEVHAQAKQMELPHAPVHLDILAISAKQVHHI